ncbi:MAG: hypothetical protein IT233_05350 [Bacteroidia bacterium]|nr:hypothetical protein [Bacteroidia bacterium]
MIRFAALFFLLIRTSFLFSTTWNEPWHREVVKKSESFVKAKIISCHEDKGIKIKILKTLAGTERSGELEVQGFFLLDLCSVSGGHGPEWHFEKGDEYYFFIGSDKKGKPAIATPTTGFALVMDDEVKATYRHSYHQAMVPVGVYEMTMTAIFRSSHGQPYDTLAIREYISKWLLQAPAAIQKESMKIFFAQHVALECVYHLNLSGYYKQLVIFLSDTLNHHNQISAARALASYASDDCTRELVRLIESPATRNFVKVICIWSLASQKPTGIKEKLKEMEGNASDEESGFGGNIMDPRVCTHFPSVKEALAELIKNL